MNIKEAKKKLSKETGFHPDELTEDLLSDLVHEAKGSEAADINNAGIEAQLSYLIETEVRDDDPEVPEV